MGKKNPEKLHLSNITKQFNLVNRNVFKRKKKEKALFIQHKTQN